MSFPLVFCPFCANLLDLELTSGTRKTRFSCPTCPYICPIKSKLSHKIYFPKKEIEPIFTADEMKRAPKTAVSCPKCHHGEAYYRQMQIRSADEPMTTLYRCCSENCGHDWRED